MLRQKPLRLYGVIVFLAGCLGFLGDIADAPEAARRVLSWFQITPTYQGTTLALVALGIVLIAISHFLPPPETKAAPFLDSQSALAHRCINVVMIPAAQETLAEVESVFLSPHEVTPRSTPPIILLSRTLAREFQSLRAEAEVIAHDSPDLLPLLKKFAVFDLSLTAVLERHYSEVPRLMELDKLRRSKAHVSSELRKVSTDLLDEASSEVTALTKALKRGR